MGGGGGAQCPVWHSNEPKKTGARSARARTRGQNPLVQNNKMQTTSSITFNPVPRNKQKKISVRTKTNQNQICFSFVSVCFVKPKTKSFVLFWSVSVFGTYIKTIETNRTVSKQTETTLNFHKNTKICSLSNCFAWSSVCFGSIET
jgi:hypothetical protein